MITNIEYACMMFYLQEKGIKDIGYNALSEKVGYYPPQKARFIKPYTMIRMKKVIQEAHNNAGFAMGTHSTIKKPGYLKLKNE